MVVDNSDADGKNIMNALYLKLSNIQPNYQIGWKSLSEHTKLEIINKIKPINLSEID